MFKAVKLLLLSILALVTIGSQPIFASLNIVTGTTNIEAMTKAIVKDRATVVSLLKGYQNPHYLTVKPGHLKALKGANVMIATGVDMEPWLDGLIESSGNRNIKKGTKGYINASVGIKILEVPTVKIDRSMGDIHALGNPHYTLDPVNVRRITLNIVKGLSLIDPANAEFYKANRTEYVDKIDRALYGNELVNSAGGYTLYKKLIKGELDSFLKLTNQSDKLGGWLGKMKKYKGLKIIAYHKSWTYLAKRFGINIVEFIEPKPGVPPSGKHVKYVIDVAKSQNIKIILLEPFFRNKVPNMIAEEINGKVLIIPSEVNGVKGITSYTSVFDYIFNEIATNTKGN